MKKLIIWIIVLAVVATLGYGGWKWLASAAKAETGPPSVRTDSVMRGDLVEMISAPGQIEPRTKVSISARVSSRIDALPFKEGDRVTAGDKTKGIPASILVKLDSTEVEATLKQAKARKAGLEVGQRVALMRMDAQRSQLKSTRITLADAQRDLRIQKELLASQDVAKTTVDAAQAKVDGLVAQLESAEHTLAADDANLAVVIHDLDSADAEIKKIQESLAYTTIETPIDGVVTRINAKVGEVVIAGTMNNAGTVILEVADLSQMVMETRVDEVSIARVEKGQKATVRIQAYPDETFEGAVDTVALTHTDDKDGSKYFKTTIPINGKGKRVLAGLTADADIETMRHKNVLRVPSQTVLGRRIDELPGDLRKSPEIDQSKTMATVVFRIIDGKAVITPVAIGPSDETHTIIKSGLKEGDRIITGPYKILETLQNDTAVKDDKPTSRPTTTQSSTQPATQPTTRPTTQRHEGTEARRHDGRAVPMFLRNEDVSEYRHHGLEARATNFSEPDVFPGKEGAPEASDAGIFHFAFFTLHFAFSLPSTFFPSSFFLLS
ncbi:MAG: efflux RND transporter periplasmic adaptor subunit [Tepidisphaeraceae bacterium]